MPVLTIHPNGYDTANSTFDVINSSYPINNSCCSEIDNSNLTRIDFNQGENAETYFYYTFDLSALPAGATIDLVTCSTKGSTSNNTSTYISSATAYMTTGTTMKGSAVTLPTSSAAFCFNTGSWTEAELRNAKLCFYAKRASSNVTTAYFFRCYGATINIYYNTKHTITVNPSGYDSVNSSYKSINSSYPITNGYAGFTSTSQCQIYDTLGDNAETVFYYTFNLSSLPDNAIIDYVACQTKAYSSATSGLPTRYICLTSGTTEKSNQIIMISSNLMQAFGPLKLTVAELRNAAIKLYVQRDTTSSSTDRTIRFYGATLTIGYSLPSEGVLWKKDCGLWHKVETGYSKASGTWSTATTPASMLSLNGSYTQGYLLPSGYTLLSYIKSNGAQYIDTGIVPNANTKVECDFELTRVDTTNRAIFGVLGQYTFRKYSTPTFRTNGGNNIDFSTTPTTKRYLVTKTPTSCTLKCLQDGTTETKTNTAGSCTLTMSIFAYHSAESTYGANSYINLYSFKVYSSNTLVRHYLPCKNASGVIGLYDIVNNTFSPSATTTAFVPGDELVKTP